MSRREIDDLLEEAKSLGWTVERSKKHWKLLAPDAVSIVICPLTPSDCRSVKNTRAQIRRFSIAPLKPRYN